LSSNIYFILFICQLLDWFLILKSLCTVNTCCLLQHALHCGNCHSIGSDYTHTFYKLAVMYGMLNVHICPNKMGLFLVRYCGNALNIVFSDNFQYSTVFLSVILKTLLHDARIVDN